MMVLTVIVVGIFKTTTILGNAYGAPRAPRRVRVCMAGLAACEHTVSAGPLAVRGTVCLTCQACLASEPARARGLRATRGAALPPRSPTSMPAPLAARRARRARPTRAPAGRRRGRERHDDRHHAAGRAGHARGLGLVPARRCALPARLPCAALTLRPLPGHARQPPL